MAIRQIFFFLQTNWRRSSIFLSVMRLWSLRFYILFTFFLFYLANKYHLGKRYILETRNDQDESAVVIRNTISGNFIEIPAVRWASLLLLLTDIEEAVGKLLDKKPVSYFRSIGGGWYISVSTTFGCVDIRQFTYNDHGEIMPTSQGLELEIAEWCHLMNQLLIIMTHEPNLCIVRPCSMREDHINNPSVVQSCMECTPFKGFYSEHTFPDEQNVFNFVSRLESLSMNWTCLCAYV